MQIGKNTSSLFSIICCFHKFFFLQLIERFKILNFYNRNTDGFTFFFLVALYNLIINQEFWTSRKILLV